MNDAWANPYGTQMSFWAAREVYQYLGFPNQIAAHYREGVHNHTIEDMEAFLDFCDDSFYNIRPTQDLRNAPKPNAAKPYTWVHP